ncbi:TMAO reductase system sensor histidine kinase/response regulator TorS [Vibrio furnissii]|uniref:TMAO reductase system sensor histidine kinase/response regulator TorS n=1 Tax=Vibrio furnissii TaxID=29494 RepID=UPI001E517A77|nr:TMAO reductase system sensor histidine kinase/response regulator TorS [Vibrio furnissii]UHJ62193.1 TMAO reductase system sensor histidine kinase/response regulator TorS [Vibrio furnissii]
MRISKTSIGHKLLLSFIAMACLVLSSAIIGMLGFSQVSKTERQVVNSAIPAMLEARQVAELSNRIIASVHTLSNATDETQRKRVGKLLFDQLDQLLGHVKTLGQDSSDTQLLSSLEADVQSVIDTLGLLGQEVERKLQLADSLVDQALHMRASAQELEQLTRTQVLNTSTVAVANVTHIYDLLKEQRNDQVYQALDTLVEVDLDLSERLHELHLLAYKVLNEIEETRTVTDIQRIVALQQEFVSNIDVMQRRVQAVEDPTRSKQMATLLAALAQEQTIFENLIARHDSTLRAQKLATQSLDQFASLNQRVNQLVDTSNQSATAAVVQLSRTLSLAQWTLSVLSVMGLIATTLIVWRVVYQSVVKRLARHTAALLSVAKGQLHVEVDTQGHDELAEMGRAIATARDTAKALNVVAESEVQAKRELQEHKAHLEDVVEERTTQLRETNHKLNQEVLNHAKARLDAEQASRSKSVFLATMSHEIRTPMNGVLGTAHLLQDTPLSDVQRHYVNVIDQSGQNLLAILNDVLDYSKIEAGHLQIRHANFNLRHMLRHVYQLMESRAIEKGVTLNLHVDSDLAEDWQGDETRLQQVLNNLVSNAIKFTPHGHIDLAVYADPDDEQKLLFEVCDTGIGIHETDQQTLFDAFTQAEAGLATQGGTGLGLAISHRLVAAMQGELRCESVVGEGSRFYFSLALAAGDVCHRIDEVSLGQTAALTVLVVEDNDVNQLVAEGFLTSLGHHAVMASNVKEALRLFAQQRFDVALLDINLPDGDGVSLLKQLRAIEQQHAQTPIPMIAVSAHVFTEDVSRYLASGFDGYLPKPLVKSALANALAAHMRAPKLPETTARNMHSIQSQSQLIHHQSMSHQSMPDQSMPHQSNTALINVAQLEEDVAVLGRDKMREIMTYFADGARQALVIFSASTSSEEAVKQAAHKLKGSAGSLGLIQAMTLCQSIEQADSPQASAQSLYVELETTIAASLVELDALLSRDR